MRTASPDYVKELLGGEEPLTPVQFWQAERRGRDREDKPDYKVKLSVALCFSNRAKPDRVLPQLQLPGARRLPGAGGASGHGLPDRRLSQAERQVPQK